MTSFATADLCDAHESQLHDGHIRVLQPLFRAYGGRPAFHGPIVTLKLFEDNSLLRDTLSNPGEGRVLVVDGGGSLRCALVGDNIAAMAAKNGWAGIVVNGCIRDAAVISSLDIGIRALATHPQKSIKKGLGECDVRVAFAGTTLLPGEFLYADEDGIIVSPAPLI